MLTTVLFALGLTQVAASSCNSQSQAAGLCDLHSSLGDAQVDVRGESGAPNRGNLHADAPGLGSEDGADDGLNCDDPLRRCGVYEVVSRPEPTLADVASFAPEVAPLVPEPAGVGVVGMPVNVVAAAAEHTREGELFDLPVRVRFQPQSFLFDYGDGTTRESPTGGRTWNQLGAAQLTPTPTSHVYDHRGTYTARVTIRFRADVDFGNGWTRVPGLLDIPAHTTRITILEAHTALVQHTCHETPHAPGC
jgi:hypothetical protein